MGRSAQTEGARERARNASFAARLRRAREAAGLSQEDLAERAGLTPNAVGALERGERRYPYPSTIRALADAIGMSGDERAAFAAAVPKRGEDSSIPGLHRLALPAALSPLIGREGDVATISTLLRHGGVRLVTLTGPGGVGKTSLALRVASDLAGNFADGAAFVPLAAIRDPAFVASAVAQAVGVGDQGSQSFVDRIGERLRDRHLLLVIDNFEHLLDAAPLVTELLARCEGLVVIATSRAALRLAGEHDVPVSPLALADPRLSDPTQIARAAAIQLFAERARAVDPTFALTAENTATVAAICHRLDGIPLAIELAAARSRLFPPAAFLVRLAQRLPLLTGGRRDAPHRHRTMRDAISWSHDLLTPDEQTLFRRLATFAGGFTLDAAGAVAGRGGQRYGAEGDKPEGLRGTALRAEGERGRRTRSGRRSPLPLSPSRRQPCPPQGVSLVPLSPSGLSPSVLDGIATLVDQRLLYRVDGPAGEPRYAMLETIREYAVDLLVASGEEAALRDAHTAWCLAFADEAAPHWFTVDQSIWADRADAEHENLRAALAYTLELPDCSLARQLASRIWPFWIVRGHIWEGWRWMEQVLARDDRAPTIERVRILTGAARFQRYLGEESTARALGEEALSLAEGIGVATGIDAAYILIGLAHTAAIRRDFEQAAALNERALAILRPLKASDPRAAHLECLTFLYLANVVVEFDDDVRATELANAALAHSRRFGWAWGEIECLCCLAPLAFRRADIPAAAALCRDGLVLAVEQRDPGPIIMLLDFAGIVAGATSHAPMGARLIGAADHVAASLSLRPGYLQYNGRDQGIAALRQNVGAATFDTLVAEGKGITLDEAVSHALALTEQIILSTGRDE